MELTELHDVVVVEVETLAAVAAASVVVRF